MHENYRFQYNNFIMDWNQILQVGKKFSARSIPKKGAWNQQYLRAWRGQRWMATRKQPSA